MIEEGYYNHTISHTIIEEYLSNVSLKNIQSLILACTHYPLIMNEIKEIYNDSVEVLDSASLVAETIKDTLFEYGILSYQKGNKDLFYVSDYTSAFNESTKLFFKNNIDLKEYKLWE